MNSLLTRKWLLSGLLILIAIIIGILSSRFFGHDSLIEECCEKYIEENIGLTEGSLDLTPTSPEQ